MTGGSGRVRAFVIDVSDLDHSVRFWGEVLGIAEAGRYQQYVWLDEVAPGIRLVLQRVDDPKVVKNRVHVDISHPDPAALLERVVELGGSEVREVEDPAYSLVVAADPDGNEFCINRRMSEALGDEARAVDSTAPSVDS